MNLLVTEERIMAIATIAVDLAKSVFEIAAADEAGRIVERRRLTRGQFDRYFQNRSGVHVVMEACGSSHHWARRFEARGRPCRKEAREHTGDESDDEDDEELEVIERGEAEEVRDAEALRAHADEETVQDTLLPRNHSA